MTSTYSPVTNSDRTTTYVPLITPFTASEECSSYFFVDSYLGASDSFVTGLHAWWNIFGANTTIEQTCYPDAVTSAFYAFNSQDKPSKSLGMAADEYFTTWLYAPFSCPGGWHAVSSGTDSTASTTACCPSDYEVQIKYYNDLMSESDSGGTASVVCQSDLSSRNISYSYYSEYDIGAPNRFGIKMKTSSMSISDVSTVTVYAMTGYNFAQSTSEIATTTSLGSESTNSVKSGSSGGLDTGAKAGIGVGVSVGVLLVLGALLFYFRRRRSAPKNAENESAEEPMSETSRDSVAELPVNFLTNGSQLQHELHNPTDRPELLGSYAHTGELPDTSKNIPQEMDATGDHVSRNNSRS